MQHLIFATDQYYFMAVQLQQSLALKHKHVDLIRRTNRSEPSFYKGEVPKGFGEDPNDRLFKVGEIDFKKFPDGEYYSKIQTPVRGKHCTLIGGTITDHDLVELYSLASTLVQMGAKSLTLIIPYFGYSTMERQTSEGEVVAAKVRAKLLSSLPKAMEGNRVLLLDLHTEGIPYYFEGDLRAEHVYAKPVIMEIIKNHAKRFSEKEAYVLGSTDAGRAKWVESLAKELGCSPAFVYKNRTSSTETQITGVNANVKGKHVIIYDDMIRTGGSLIKAAEAYMKAGAKSISAVTTHGVFPTVDGVHSLQKLADSGLFKKVGFTDSYAPLKNLDNFCKVGEMTSVVEVFMPYYEGYF